jgi:hypothetical protein
MRRIAIGQLTQWIARTPQRGILGRRICMPGEPSGKGPRRLAVIEAK